VWMEVMSVAPEARYPALAFRETGGGGMMVPVGADASQGAAKAQRPPAVVPVSAPPRVEAVPPGGAPPRVAPVLNSNNP
jgi:hypothetical protein